MPRSRYEAGFTLIELLVVVIIIGILAAIAIPLFLGQRESAMAAAAESDVHNAAIVIEAQYAENDGYPADNVAFQALVTAGEIAVSPQVTLSYALDGPAAYSITADHGGTTASPDAVWDSDAGGLQ